jgi:hypothetical protein
MLRLNHKAQARVLHNILSNWIEATIGQGDRKTQEMK